MTQLTALAEKVEGAEGASRELDEVIARLFQQWPNDGDYDAVESGIWRGNRRGGMLLTRSDGFAVGSRCAPSYTVSLDAARTLVPEGWSFSLGEKRGLPKHIRFLAWLNDHNTPDGLAVRHVEGSAATPALALTAAALRAQAALSSNKSEK